MTRKILAIDDEPEILELLKTRLDANGYDVITATECNDGINKARSEQPGLILMDIMMPNLSGGEVVRKLKEEHSTQNIPIVFVTGAYDKDDDGDNIDINVDGQYYKSIAKPFDSETLLETVKQFF